MIDLREQDPFTIDGMLELHETHGDNVTVVLTLEQLAYVHSQLKSVGWGIRTFQHGRQCTITFSLNAPSLPCTGPKREPSTPSPKPSTHSSTKS